MQCMKALGLVHRPTFRKNYLQPALAARLIERTLPDKPNSRLQKYRRTQPSLFLPPDVMPDLIHVHYATTGESSSINPLGMRRG